MPSLLNLNAYLGIQPEALELQSRRMEVLADNLANVDTPNYKARDIDFRAALAAAAPPSGSPGASGADAPVELETTDPRDLGAAPAAGGTPELKYRVPLAPSLDGNTVDAQLEQAAFADNSVRYQATLTIISTSLRNLMTAITGS